MFIQAIPFNFYAILTIVMMVGMALMKLEFGSMAKFEHNAETKGDLWGGKNPYAGAEEEEDGKGIVLDLVLPVAVLILSCVIGMIYSGGFFEGASFIEAFSNSDASLGLMLGSAFALAFTLLYYCLRKTMNFRETMGCIPEGFRAMVPAILILTFAWSLNTMTGSLGAKEFVAGIVKSSAGGFQSLLPAVVFLIGCFLGYLRHTYPHHTECLPADESSWCGMRVRLYGRGRLRRPLLAYLRHHHHGLCWGPVRPRGPCFHPAALYRGGGGRQLCGIYRRWLCPKCADSSAHSYSSDGGGDLWHKACGSEESGVRKPDMNIFIV